MKKILLGILVLISVNVSGQDFISSQDPGVLPWALDATWIQPGWPDTTNCINTVLVRAYVDQDTSLSFLGTGSRFTVGVGDPVDPDVITNYDILVVRGDLSINKGDANDQNGFTILENGIVIVFGDLLWDKNKALVTNNGILAVTGSIVGKGSAGQNTILGSGLVVMNQINDVPPTFPLENFSLDNTLGLAAADIVTDVCNPLYTPAGISRDVLNALCEFLGNGGSAPLPVELLAFKARIEDQKPTLDWVTASELNNDFFLIQRSYDGKQYRNIGQVAGRGTTSEEVEYSYTDESAAPGMIYYRLVQTDFDGTTETFGPLSVTLRSLTNGMVVYPNPVDNELLTMQINGLESGREAVIQIADLSGRTVFTQNIMVDREESINLEYEIANRLPGGAYILNVVQGNSRYSEKLIKL